MKFSPTKLKALLDERGLTMYAADVLCGFLNQKTGRPSGQVGHILTGNRKILAETCARLAAGFGVPMEYFFEKDENNGPKT